VITTKVYETFLDENNIRNKIVHLLRQLNYKNEISLEFTSQKIQSLILSKKLSEITTIEIFDALRQLQNL